MPELPEIHMIINDDFEEVEVLITKVEQLNPNIDWKKSEMFIKKADLVNPPIRHHYKVKSIRFRAHSSISDATLNAPNVTLNRFSNLAKITSESGFVITALATHCNLSFVISIAITIE